MRIQRQKYFSDSVPWNRSEHMRQLHASGRYIGTSKLVSGIRAMKKGKE